MAGLPQYAAGVPRHMLVKCLCKGSCGKMVYAKVSKYPWREAGAAGDPELWATCLRCGNESSDEYNWIRV